MDADIKPSLGSGHNTQLESIQEDGDESNKHMSILDPPGGNVQKIFDGFNQAKIDHLSKALREDPDTHLITPIKDIH